MRRILVFACVAAAFFAMAAAPSRSAAPPNDDLRSARKLNRLPYAVADLDLTHATTETGEPLRNACGRVSRTVWYRARSRDWSAFRIDGAGSDFPLVITAYWDLRRSGGGLVEMGCATNGAGDDGAFTADLPRGDYLIQAGVLDDGVGVIGNPRLSIAVEAVAPNCAFANVDREDTMGVIALCGLEPGATGFIDVNLRTSAPVVLFVCGAHGGGQETCYDASPPFGGIFAGCNTFVQKFRVPAGAPPPERAELRQQPGSEMILLGLDAAPDTDVLRHIRSECREQRPRPI